MKVVILCGGQGTRMREETEYRPKSLVQIGGMPILWHIMKIYSHYGFNDFILCLGYKGDMIKDYFLKFEEMSNNFTLNLRSKKERIIHHSRANLENWNITFVDTGLDAMTGARIARIKEFIGLDETFFLTYGDGLADVDISKLLKFYQRCGKIAIVTGVRQPSRFGELVVKGSNVLSFAEKPSGSGGYINGGFFVLSREVFKYVSDSADCVFEQKPLERLAAARQLVINKHTGFWQSMDTYRDFLVMEEAWQNNPAWKVWEK